MRRWRWVGGALSAMMSHLQRRGASGLQAMIWCNWMEGNCWPAGGDTLVCQELGVQFLMLGPDHGEITGISDRQTGEVLYEGEVIRKCSGGGSQEPCQGGSSGGPTYTT